MASIVRRAFKALGLLPPARGPVAIPIPVFSFAPRRGSAALLRAYRENSTLRTVANVVADSVAAARWRVYKRAGLATKGAVDFRVKGLRGPERTKALRDMVNAGELVELPDHELLRILNQPHPKWPGLIYRRLLQLYLDLPGESFLWWQRNEAGRVVGFQLLPPHCVSQTPQPGRPYYFVSYNLFHGTVPEADMAWWREPDLENPEGRGTGAGMALGDEIDTVEAIGRATKATFERGGLPAAVVGMDSKSEDIAGELDEQAEDLQKKYEESFSGPDNAGKVWFVPGGVTLAQVQQNFRELQTKEIADGVHGYIERAYNVPPEIVGRLTGSDRDKSEAAQYHLAEYATMPRLQRMQAWLELTLVPQVDPDVLLDFDDPRPTQWVRTFRLMTTPPTAAFTFNEVRRFAGYPEDPALGTKRPSEAPGSGFGPGNNLPSQQANATPDPPPPMSEV